MGALAIAAIIFVLTFGGALLGIFLRGVLPGHQFGDDSKDAVRLGMGLVATMAALVLGLLVASAKGSYDTQRNGLDDIAATLLLLDHTLAEYGPDATKARTTLRQVVTAALARVWPQDASQTPTLGEVAVMPAARTLYDEIQGLAPENDLQRTLQSKALDVAASLAKARWLLAAQQESGAIPMPFLVVLTFWLSVLFVSFGLFAPPNVTVIVTLLLSAASIAGAIFLTLELADPFQGLIQVPSGPLRDALAHLG